MIINYLTDFICTLLLALIVLSTSNVLYIGIVFILIKIIHNNAIMNPAITILLYYNNTIDIMEIIPYCLSQITGALFALYIHNTLRQMNVL